jgi:formylglycine-generating enzyme required for sulfatase activity
MRVSLTRKGGRVSNREIITNIIGQELSLIPAGIFRREFIETWWDPELVVHDDSELRAVIKISQPYYMGRTVVTQGQWKKVMNTTPWREQDFVKDGDDYPAVYVSWDDAMQFCEKLTELEKEKYRLPTESEWENACRGGTTTRFFFGDDDQKLGSYACSKATHGISVNDMPIWSGRRVRMTSDSLICMEMFGNGASIGTIICTPGLRQIRVR